MWDSNKQLIRPFVGWVEISKAASTELADGTRLVSGPVAAVGVKDYDGETLNAAGILKGLEMHQRLKGQVDYEHKYDKDQDPDYLIGLRKSVENRNGIPFMVTELYKDHPLSDKVWKAIQRGVPMGYSISGFATRRDPKDKSHVLETEIHRVTITASPKGFEGTYLNVVPSMDSLAKALVSEVQADSPNDMWMESGAASDRLKRIETQVEVLTKAMTTGSGIVQAGEGGGAALREQQIDEGGGTERRCARCKRKLKSGGKSKLCFPCAAAMHSAIYDDANEEHTAKSASCRFSDAVNRMLGV